LQPRPGLHVVQGASNRRLCSLPWDLLTSGCRAQSGLALALGIRQRRWTPSCTCCRRSSHAYVSTPADRFAKRTCRLPQCISAPEPRSSRYPSTNPGSLGFMAWGACFPLGAHVGGFTTWLAGLSVIHIVARACRAEGDAFCLTFTWRERASAQRRRRKIVPHTFGPASP
jgi:hypothetical protein